MQSICYSEWTERECIVIGTHVEGGVVLHVYNSWVDCYRDKPPLERQGVEPVAMREAIHRLSIFTFHLKNISERINRRSGRTLGPGSRGMSTEARTTEGGLG